MAVVLKRKINSFSFVGIWEITEPVGALRGKLLLNKEEEKIFCDFKNDIRKVESRPEDI